MRHSYFGKKLSRSTDERKRLIKGLTFDMFLHGKIRTTLAKAKAVQPLVESLITKAKTGGSSDLYEIRRILTDGSVVKQLLTDAKTRFSARTSGYTRILKLGRRPGDNAEEVLFSFVDPLSAVTPKDKTPSHGIKSKKDLKQIPLKKKDTKDAKAAKKGTRLVKKG